MTYQSGYVQGYLSGTPVAKVAKAAKGWRRSPVMEIARIFHVSDEEASKLYIEAMDAGYDVGRPRDKG